VKAEACLAFARIYVVLDRQTGPKPEGGYIFQRKHLTYEITGCGSRFCLIV